MDHTFEKIQLALLELLSAEGFDEGCEKIVIEAQKLAKAEFGSIAILEKGQLRKKYVSSPHQIVSTFSSSFSIPLLTGKKKFGVLVLYSAKLSHFTSEEKVVLTTYVAIASLILEKLRLHDETKATLLKREEHISYASHEIRNPLTAINGYIQLLYAKKEKDSSAEYRWIKQMYQDSMQFTKLVKDLLDIEKVKKRK